MLVLMKQGILVNTQVYEYAPWITICLAYVYVYVCCTEYLVESTLYGVHIFQRVRCRLRIPHEMPTTWRTIVKDKRNNWLSPESR